MAPARAVVRPMIRGLAAVAATVAALGASGCLGGGDTSGSAREGGAAFVALGGDRPVRDPAVAGAADAGALWLVYTSPLTYRRAEGAEGTELIPGVARALPRVSGDGLTYSFRVRRGLRFSNDRPVRASDVRHSIRRAARLGAVGRRLFAGVTAIAADDGSGEVRIRLGDPDASFPHALAAVQAGVVPASTPMRDASGSPPAGVGPYRMLRRQRGSGLVRNRDFRLPGIPPGLIDFFRLGQAGRRADQVEAVEAGRLDVMTETPPVDALPELRSEYKDRYLEQPAIATRYVSVSAARAPLSTPEAREALAYAIDKPEAARRLAGLGRPTCNLLPPNLPGYKERDACPWGDPDEPPDLERARDLVDESDLEDEVITIAASRPDRPTAREYARTLATIGLRPVLVDGRRADVTLSVAASPLPDSARFLVSLAKNVALVADPEALLMSDELRSTYEPEQEAELAEQLDRELVESAIAIPYAEVSTSVFLSARIDSANCAGVHPVYGIDLSSLCLL